MSLQSILAAAGAALLLLLCATGSPPARAASVVEPPRVLVVTTSPVPPGKFQKLATLGEAQGLKIEAVYGEKLAPETDGAYFAPYRLVLFDAPRDHLQAFLRTRLEKALAGLEHPPSGKKAPPFIWLHEREMSSQGLPEALAKRLHAYYVNGSRRNYEAFMATLAAYLGQRDWRGFPEPIVFPKEAFYHPAAPGLVFPRAADYLSWKGVRLEAPGQPHAPRIAIALHQSYIAGEQTGFIDDLIARIEAAGGIPLPFYGSVLESPLPLLSQGDRRLPDVVINTQIVLDPEGRRQQFEALGVPVIQATPYRRGDIPDWEKDRQGIPLMDVPFYLAQGEYAGIIDAQIAAATRQGDNQVVPIPAQSQSVVDKALALTRLQQTPNGEKRVAVFFWNYPPGEKNLSASFLNLPKSLANTLHALSAAGYDTREEGETVITNLLQRLLAPYYRSGELAGLLREDLAETLPVSTYRAWLATLPAPVQADLRARWGEPEASAMVLRPGGPGSEPVFVIPRARFGKLVFLPQAPRGERWEEKEKALYHSTSAAPSHFYLAQYLWARTRFNAHALVHFGTHGSQEWLPGKERGLSVHDYPLLAVGSTPVIYPYIVDNIGEALQARRRGRALIVSHQTPAFLPAGLHDATQRIHDLLHAWLAQDQGAVKDRLAADLIGATAAAHLDRDLGITLPAPGSPAFAPFVDELHTHLHELAQTAQPLGLHSFGEAPPENLRLGTVLLMLGKDFWARTALPGTRPEDLDEALVTDWTRLAATGPYATLKRYVVEGADLENLADPALVAQLRQARDWYQRLNASQELPALVRGLAGGQLATSYGGDPIKNPDAFPTGRNLYGFDPSRVPTPQAWAAGKAALDQLLAAHRQKTGRTPQKLTFSLWSVETMRHQGILEAQAFWALGVEPVMDNGGRLTDVRLIPRAELGRPRVDVVLSATGLYRDHFPNVMKLLARAVELAARARDGEDGKSFGDNPVAAHTEALVSRLGSRGLSPEAARRAAEIRIFSAESGKYGTGLDDATLATDTWRGKAEGDRKLANLYLSRMQFAFGSDESRWGEGSPAPGVNLYAEQLKGTEAAVLSRSSNLYGMLTTDDPFQYLGGIALAVRHLDGQAPALYIANLREGNTGNPGGNPGRVEEAGRFLAKELATRQFHPGYIRGLMNEGYAGTLEVLDGMNNFWGWTATAREIVRDDQWQEFAEVYVKDKYHLGLKAWFEQHNPHALAQTLERMLEAARQGYWQADPATLRALRERYRDLARRYGVQSDNRAFQSALAAAGYGLNPPGSPQAAPAAAPPAQPAPAPVQPAPASPSTPSTPPAPPLVSGLRLEAQADAAPPISNPLAALAGLFGLLLLPLLGGLRQARAQRSPSVNPIC